VLDVLAGDGCVEQALDQLHSLEQPRAAFAHLGPVATDDVFVERLAAAQPQPVATRVHRLGCCGGLRDEGRMETERRAGHAWAEVAGGSFTDRGEH